MGVVSGIAAGDILRTASSALSHATEASADTAIAALKPAGSDVLAQFADHPAVQGSQLIDELGRKTNGMPKDPQWYDHATVYQAHVRSFMDANGDGIGDFQGLTSKLDHVQYMGHDAIWILPFYESPLKDGGYDISNYYKVNPQYGSMDDFKAFVDEAHRRGIRVITELVLNHTSDQHEWFQQAIRAPKGSPERDRYVWNYSPLDKVPDQYSDTRVIFNDTEKSNWEPNAQAGGWYWHRFFKEQPDLNWDNPQVVDDMHKVVDHWLDAGVDGIRLDAVPYLFEREGAQGENLPETHQELKNLRAHIDSAYADRMMLAEANMSPEETRKYFGDGDEAHTAFNFPLMPRLFMGTLEGDKNHVIEGLQQTSAIPEGTSWLTFLRNHDEMTLEKVTPEQRENVWSIYRDGRPEEGIPADPRAPINLGVRLRLSDLMGNNSRRVEMMKSMLYSMPGTPIEYYGDEIGMATHRGLNDRDGVRLGMQWNDARNGGFSAASPDKLFLPAIDDAKLGAQGINVAAQKGDPNSMLERTRTLIATRKASSALMGGDTSIVDTSAKGVVAYRRKSTDDDVVAAVNLTNRPVTTSLNIPDAQGKVASQLHGSDPIDLGNDSVPSTLTLEPYGYQWLRLSDAAHAASNASGDAQRGAAEL